MFEGSISTNLFIFHWIIFEGVVYAHARYNIVFSKCSLFYLNLRKCILCNVRPGRLTSAPRIRAVWSKKKICILGYPKCAKWRFWSDFADVQTDLNLCWAHMFEGCFLLLWLRSFALLILIGSANFWEYCNILTSPRYRIVLGKQNFTWTLL